MLLFHEKNKLMINTSFNERTHVFFMPFWARKLHDSMLQACMIVDLNNSVYMSDEFLMFFSDSEIDRNSIEKVREEGLPCVCEAKNLTSTLRSEPALLQLAR